MPFKTKLSSLVNMQWLINNVSLKKTHHNNSRNSRGHNSPKLSSSSIQCDKTALSGKSEGNGLNCGIEECTDTPCRGREKAMVWMYDGLERCTDSVLVH